jgi:hypothetical protein
MIWQMVYTELKACYSRWCSRLYLCLSYLALRSIVEVQVINLLLLLRTAQHPLSAPVLDFALHAPPFDLQLIYSSSLHESLSRIRSSKSYELIPSFIKRVAVPNCAPFMDGCNPNCGIRGSN